MHVLDEPVSQSHPIGPAKRLAEQPLRALSDRLRGRQPGRVPVRRSVGGVG